MMSGLSGFQCSANVEAGRDMYARAYIYIYVMPVCNINIMIIVYKTMRIFSLYIHSLCASSVCMLCLDMAYHMNFYK